MKLIRNLIISILLFVILDCSNVPIKNERIIIIKGSDTMFHLTETLADSYSEKKPNVSFHIYGGGTKTGIVELLAGRVDICTASRDLTPCEAKKLADYYGSIGMYYLIAKDAVCIYENPKGKVNNLTTEQLKKIFKCEITDLQQINLGNGRIKLAIRNSDSGTRKFLSDLVSINDEYCKSANVFSTTKEIVEFVKNNKNSFGFGGIGLADGAKIISINGIQPNIQNIKSDKYPLTRYLHFFTSRSPSGDVKDFIDWVLGPAGQKIIKKEGFIPLWEINY